MRRRAHSPEAKKVFERRIAMPFEMFSTDRAPRCSELEANAGANTEIVGLRTRRLTRRLRPRIEGESIEPVRTGDADGETVRDRKVTAELGFDPGRTFAFEVLLAEDVARGQHEQIGSGRSDRS